MEALVTQADHVLVLLVGVILIVAPHYVVPFMMKTDLKENRIKTVLVMMGGVESTAMYVKTIMRVKLAKVETQLV
ncbi:unnamed protein product [Absidia cylindrospora]